MVLNYEWKYNTCQGWFFLSVLTEQKTEERWGNKGERLKLWSVAGKHNLLKNIPAKNVHKNLRGVQTLFYLFGSVAIFKLRRSVQVCILHCVKLYSN